MPLVYIHGANATGKSFNYIRSKISSSQELILEYHSSQGFRENLNEMKTAVSSMRDIFFVAHSLGGIYALHLADQFPDQVLGAVTLSTPYGGIEIAEMMRFFLPHNRLIRDIGPNSWPIQQAEKIKPKNNWTNIVTTRGNCLWISQPNDGVVSVNSQRHLAKHMAIVEVDCNHYEVVLNDTITEIIQRKILDINT
jgi:predicted esterase YcpF (UPF0227 family)